MEKKQKEKFKMDEIKELRSLVNELTNKLDNVAEDSRADKEVVIVYLQKIGAEFLKKYEIRIGNITIEPLRVEPYLFKEDAFEDKFTHYIVKDDKQKYYGPQQRNRFGKLYIHSGYSGVDIVLSDNDNYAFSLLIKNSRILINGNVEYPFLKQDGVAEVLKDNGIAVDYDEIVLCKKETPSNSIVFRTIRNGLRKIAERDDFPKEKQAEYSFLMISSFIELKEHTSKKFDFSCGYGGDKAVVEYLKDYINAHPGTSRDELDKLRKELYPNGSKTEFVKEFGK